MIEKYPISERTEIKDKLIFADLNLMHLRIVLTTFLLLGFELFAAAQEPEPNAATQPEPSWTRETRLFDEFGPLSNCALGARIQNLFVEMGEYPGTRGFMIIYRGADALPGAQLEGKFQRQIKRIKNEVKFLNLSESRLEIVDGGYRKSNTIWHESWIIPEGGAMPQPSNTVAKTNPPTDIAYKVDESNLYFTESWLVKPGEEIEQTSDEIVEPAEEISAETATVENTDGQNEEIGETEADELSTENEADDWISDYFAEALKGNKNYSGVVIYYADDAEYDLAKFRQEIDEGLRRSARKSAGDLSGVKIVYGGYRKDAKIEFWVVPKGAKEPLPTPESRTEKE